MTTPPRVIQPDGMPASRLALSPATAAGDFVFISGQVALGDDGQVIGAGDTGAQTTAVIARIARILAAVGAGLSSVVSTTVYLPSFTDYATFDAAYAEAFGAHRPARATVQAGLNHPGFLVEIQAIAFVPGSGRG